MADRIKATTAWQAQDKCFSCGEPGHYVRECPKRKKYTDAPPAQKKQKVQARVYALTKEDAKNSTFVSEVSLLLICMLNFCLTLVPHSPSYPVDLLR